MNFFINIFDKKKIRKCLTSNKNSLGADFTHIKKNVCEEIITNLSSMCVKLMAAEGKRNTMWCVLYIYGGAVYKMIL